jgi:hypothetical protein
MSQTRGKRSNKGQRRRTFKTLRAEQRNTKLAEAALPEATVSKANKAFASGLNRYRSFHDQKIVDRFIQKAKEKLDKLPSERFYVIHHNRLYPLSKIPEFVYFGVLYKGKNPTESYFYQFDQDEDENNYSHYIRYFYRVQEYPPFFYAIFTNWNELESLTNEQKALLYTYAFGDEFHIWDVLRFLNEDPRFQEAYKQSLVARSFAPQKLEQLREKTLEALISRSAERTGQNVGENVEARIRSYLSSRPFSRNYSGVAQNFRAIDTSLFE